MSEEKPQQTLRVRFAVNAKTDPKYLYFKGRRFAIKPKIGIYLPFGK